MKRVRLTRLFLPAMLAMLLICSASCGKKVVYQIPPLKERAVPDLPLGERPVLDLTDDEAGSLYKFSPIITGKILKNQIAWVGYADIAESVRQGYRDYLLKIFSEEPRKK